jgi:Ca2+-binding EF-hand superfamily protein
MEAREIFDTADLDGGGTIDFEEFSEVGLYDSNPV